jgi:hypothetical protein
MTLPGLYTVLGECSITKVVAKRLWMRHYSITDLKKYEAAMPICIRLKNVNLTRVIQSLEHHTKKRNQCAKQKRAQENVSAK